MQIFAILVICLAVAFFVSELLYRFLRIPRVVGQIIAGTVFGIPFVRAFIFEGLDIISFLSDLGMVFLLLLAGLEIGYQQLKATSKDAFLVSFFSALVPFLLGFFVMRLFGYSNVIAFIVGACLSITAAGTMLGIFMELGILKTRLARIVISASIIDDMFEIMFLAVVLVIAHGTAQKLIMFPFQVVIFVVVLYIFLTSLPKVLKYIQKDRTEINELMLAIIVGLSIAALSTILGLGPIIGAFAGGIALQFIIPNKREEHKVMRNLKIITFGFIVPFFFIHIGINFNYLHLITAPFLILTVLVVATVGKVVGSIVVKVFSKLTLKQTTLVGWMMNSRGAVELVIAEVARSNNLITMPIYSAIVVMAIITTLSSPFVLQRMINRNPGIMN